MRSAADRALLAVSALAALVVLGAFTVILFEVGRGGISGLRPSFLLEAPRNGGRAGGIAPVLISTAMIIGVCLAVTVPIGVGAACFLAEIGRDRRRTRVIRLSLDVLAGVPSVVFGLFGSILFCRWLGMGYSVLAGGLTLACMVLPLVVRTTEAALRSVDDDVRRAAAALGFGRASALLRLILPAAVPGLMVGLVLATARGLAETAALLFTSGYVDRQPRSLLDPGRTLSIHIYDLAMNLSGGDRPAFTTALVLMIVLLIINGVALGIGDTWFRRRVVWA